MRIGVLALGRITRTGGGRTVLNALLKALCNEMTIDDQCFIFVSKGQEPVVLESCDKASLVGVPAGANSATAEVFSQFVIPLLSRRMRLDVLFCPNNRCPLISPVPTVLMVQVRMFHFTDYDPLSKRIGDMITRLSMLVASGIVVASANHREDLLRHMGIPADKVRVIHLAVDEGGMKSLIGTGTDNNFLQSLGISRPYVLFVSVLRPYKNLETAIKAFSLLVYDYGHDMDFVIAGDYEGPYKKAYQSLIEDVVAKSGVSDRLHFLGDRTFEEVCKLYAGASIFVLPSRYEGFGLPVIEAMAAGIPVVTSDSWALPEVAGDAALFVEPDDVAGLARMMDKILVDKHLRAGLVEKGRHNVKRFSWEKSARSLYNILAESAARGSV